jgi:DNA-binding PadR family transcriptional regulator
VFHKDEGRGPASGWHGRPEDSNEHRGHGFRRHHSDEEGPGPGFGRGPWGPGEGGRGPGRGGRGRMGWLPRDLMFGHGRGPMVRRGDVRTAILTLLAEEPMHGYQIIQRLGQRSGGMWRPSAGSVYPTLQQLEDEGLVKGEERDGRKVFALTDDGRQTAGESAGSRAPWEMPGADEATSLYGQFRPLAAAVAQVSQVGSPETIAKAQAILMEARRSLYRLLADETGQDPTTTAE